MCSEKKISKKERQKNKPTKKQIREGKLAAALRKNLKIRKSEKQTI